MATGQVGFVDPKMVKTFPPFPHPLSSSFSKPKSSFPPNLSARQTKKHLLPTRLNPPLNRLQKTRTVRDPDALPADRDTYLSRQRAKRRRENEQRRKEEEKVARVRKTIFLSLSLSLSLLPVYVVSSSHTIPEKEKEKEKGKNLIAWGFSREKREPVAFDSTYLNPHLWLCAFEKKEKDRRKSGS